MSYFLYKENKPRRRLSRNGRKNYSLSLVLGSKLRGAEILEESPK
jgi:hypothetical protein